jgi:hypothetical protein
MILTETGVPGLLWHSLRGRKACVVAMRSLCHGATVEHLRAIVDRLRRTGAVTTLSETIPGRLHHRDVGDLMRLTDVFSETESWLGTHFAFDKAEERFGRYAQAFRHVCSNVAFRRFDIAYQASSLGDSEFREVQGFDEFDREFLRFRFGQEPSRGRAHRVARWLLNFGVTAGVVLATLCSILRVTRLSRPPAEDVFLGSEYLSTHDPLLWDEVVGEPNQLVVVPRNRAQYAEIRNALAGKRRVCRHDEGVFDLAEGLSAIVEAVRDALLLFRRGSFLPSDFYRALIVLPYRRLQFRALFNRYRFRHFWCRDEYNAEHIMRTQELRRIGGVSMAVMHGIPSICKVAHQLRYIDYDVYYLFGSDQYDLYYRETWPAHMRVRANGSHGASRSLLRQLQQSCGKNIACFLGPSFHENKIVDAVAEIARQMSDRIVFVNVKKPSYMRGSFGQAIDRLIALGLPNVRRHDGNSYELLLDCRYIINESSTLTAEAVQFGRVGLVLDLDTRFKALYYRRFPGICVNSASEAVRRIRDIEAGSWRQPVHLYKGLIEMSDRNVWDVLQEDFGLPPRERELRPSFLSAAPLKAASIAPGVSGL